MSDQQKPNVHGFAKSYLGFIDTNVLFKKPISCLFAIVSLLIPVYFLFQIIQFEIFKSNSGEIIGAAILFLLVLICAGIFGALIWWHRRIIRDEGPKPYLNFRRFVQTLGEWIATIFAIVVFFGVIILMIFGRNAIYSIVSLIPLPVPPLDLTMALAGPVIGFVIIIAMKIMLFLLDPVIWLVKQIWRLFVRIVLYFYRFVVKVHGLFEQNAPVWIGVNWLIAIVVVACGLILCTRLFTDPGRDIFLGAVITVALGLGLMAFLVVKRKNYDA
jgi:hypothetical protein